MKKIISIILTLSLVLSFGTTVFADDTDKFSDISSHWAETYILECAKTGMLSGYPDGTFRPEDNITRAEAVKVIASFLGRTTAKPTETIFTDLDVNEWYAPYVNVSSYLLPTEWTESKELKPDAFITREEAMYVISVALRYDYNLENEDLKVLDTFKDKGEIKEAYLPYVASLISRNLVSGYPDETVRPTATLTRAEFTTLVSKMLKNKEITDACRLSARTYMRDMLSVLWSPSEDMTYMLKNKHPSEAVEGEKVLRLRTDRVYRGVPYSYGGGTYETFMEYANTLSENGVYTVEGLNWEHFHGASSANLRIGNDCSSALVEAWSFAGANIGSYTTINMVPKNGFIKVGKYTSDPETNKGSNEMCVENGEQVIYNAYSQLIPGDGGVRYTTSGHAVMFDYIEVVYDENGNIDGEQSYVLTLEQTSGEVTRDVKYYDEKLGKDVYSISIVDKKYTFNTLFKRGYLPMTCKEFIEPYPIEEAKVTDSLLNPDISNLYEGTITSNRLIDSVTTTIKNENGETVQSLKARTKRPDKNTFEMSAYTTEKPLNMVGSLSIDSLEKGKYTLEVSVKLITGENVVARQFEFEI